MASVHSFNEALAKVRGVPRATIEAYSRVLRREGLLPDTKRGSGATPLTTTMVGYMLAAVMRGSPIAAAENAREVGDLVIHSVDGSTFDPMVDRPRNALGWSDGITFAQAIGWLIDRHIDGTIKDFVSCRGMGIELKVDRYWTMAWLRWEPCGQLLTEYVAGWTEALKIEPPRLGDGLRSPMEIGFHTPLLHETKISYGVDKARNREAHRKFNEMKERASKFDVRGTESVTQRTLTAIAEVFK
jgi:hypothetical protein